MRLFLYYAAHSFKNVLRKLFKTWVAVFLVACVVLGVVIGLVMAGIDEAVSEPETVLETTEDGSEARPEEDGEFSDELPDPESVLDAIELIIGALVVLMCFWRFLNGDKSGGSIFNMADVNLLFPSPRKPQSILLFRMTLQMGAMLAAALYFVFQLPNLILTLGLDWRVAVSILAVWFLILLFSNLVGVFSYTFFTTYPSAKRFVQPIAYGAMGILVLAFFFYYRGSGLTLYAAAKAFFNARAASFVPIFGWLKVIPRLIAGGKIGLLLLDLAAILLLAVGMTVAIWRFRADFYEDALSKAGEVAEALRAAQESAMGAVVRRKKDRKDSLRRELLFSGEGARVFFSKSLANRFRFAKVKIFTKTAFTYLFTAVLFAGFGRWIAKTDSVLILMLPLAAIAFFRALGNPILEDTSKNFFFLIPEKTFAKVFWSTLAGTAGCALDLIPALVVGGVLLGVDPLEAAVWFLFLLALDFYSASSGLFADLLLPESIPAAVKKTIQVLLIYGSVLPMLACILVGTLLHAFLLFVGVAAAVNAGLGLFFTSLSPLLIDGGRK